jgi:hypothetical protein
MYRDGYGCTGTSKVLLVVDTDKTVSVLCEECIEVNKDFWKPGVLVFQIGDDVTNHFF